MVSKPLIATSVPPTMVEKGWAPHGEEEDQSQWIQETSVDCSKVKRMADEAVI